ncbi:aminopeptidase PepB [Aliidiomarina sp. B3213]|nr:aminopeptidase PepB [Aliidiomarina sp. B3213]RTE85640.1 aminopeptidase PepB [Aliidiomarina sp. B3213]TCZ89609.1 aminopeptidase PepB [Lysobacter sp. N42]
MSSAIPVWLTKEECPQGVRDNSVVYAADSGFRVVLPETRQAERKNEDDEAEFRVIQTAARKLDQLGLAKVSLEGEGWTEARQWAFAKGFTDTRSTNEIVFSDDAQSSLKPLVDTYRWVRNLINLPSSEIYPESLCEKVIEKAQEVGGKAVSARMVVGPELVNEERFGIHTVGRASQHPPVLLELDFNPTGDEKAEVEYALIGKGITFDTGGYSIKGNEGMVAMKCDMGGAATVSGALILAMQQGLNKRVKLLLCCAENMIDGNAYKNGDIIYYKNGQSVEIVNTDAEGRLVLADGLIRAGELNAKYIIDAATLTGAAQVAVGTEYNALFSVDDSFANEALKIAERSHENLWRLPLNSWHQYNCPSPFADTANSKPMKGGGSGGASNAAGFLLRFAPNKGQGWLHFDLAGAYHGQANALYPAGATGLGVQTIARILTR